MKKHLIVVAGPTASGKTNLAIDLALYLGTEIVSADSRQFYRELTVGTAKPSASDLLKVQHHFINSHSVDTDFSAGQFAFAAKKVLNSIFEKFDYAVLTGGSGLYIDAVIKGIDDLPEIKGDIREELQFTYDNFGISKLQEMLKEKDPEAFSVIDLNNHRRLIRALEVCISTGNPYSSYLNQKDKTNDWHTTIIGIDYPRQVLYSRINRRTDLMIEEGLKKESLSVIGYRNKNALKTVGYKEMFSHIDGLITLEEAKNLIAQHTRNYAKRQLTWFRKYDGMIWIPSEKVSDINFVFSVIRSAEHDSN